MRRSSLPSLWLAVLVVCVSVQHSSSVLMAIDLGSEFFKIALVKPGRAPVSIVLNEMSKRKTSAAVAFVDGDRLVGEEAAALSARYPEKVYFKTRDLLGRFANDSSLASLLKAQYLPYIITEDNERGTVRIKTDTGTTYSVEELVGSILQYAKQLAKAAADGIDVVDCVITVPAYFGQNQRQSLIDAAELAGLNVLGLINTHSAAALQYGIERDLTEKTERVLFYDMGSNSVEVALIEFSSFTLKEGSKTNTYGQFVVKDVAWAENCGGETLQKGLVDHFLKAFKAQYGHDISNKPKAIAKLQKQVKRLKEMLSANTDTALIVDELHDGIDFRATISRAQLEELAGDFFTRALQPLKEVLARNELKAGDVEAVELIGGGTRVPKLKAMLSDALGGRQLDMHLDSDEAVVMGAGLFAANLSSAFRLRKFGMSDGSVYPVSFQLEAVVGPESSKPKTLLPYLKKLPVKRVVHLPDFSVDPIRFSLTYDDAPSGQLPPGAPDAQLAEFEVTGVEAALSKYNDTESVKLNAHFKVDVSGIITLDKVEALVEYNSQVAIKVPVGKKAGEAAGEEGGKEGAEAPAEDSKEPEAGASAEEPTGAPGAAEGGSSSGAEEIGSSSETKANGTSKEAPVKTEYETVMVPKKKTAKIALAVGGPGFRQPGLTAAQKQASKKVLQDLRKADEAKKEAARAKNDLEAYIIDIRDKLDSDEELAKVTTEQQRSAFNAQLTDMEEWLYMEGDAEPAAEFKKRLRELQKSGDPMLLRVRETTERPAAIAAARDSLELMRKSINAWDTIKPWINASDKDALSAKVDAFAAWLSEKEGEQQRKAAYETPAVLASEVFSKQNELLRAFNKVNNKKKPKPPPAPKAPPKDPKPDADASEESATDEGSQPGGQQEQEGNHDEL